MSKSENNKVSHDAGVVSFFTFLSRILGLVRDVIVARFFGAGLAADAFFVAFRIPNLLRRLFAEGSLTVAFIPVFTEYLNKKGRQDAFDMARIVLTILAIILTIISIAGIILAPWIVKFQAFGFGSSGAKYELTVLLTMITFPYIFFISLVAFFMGVLNSLRKFAAPAAAPIFLNLGIIGAIFLISPFFEEPIIGVAIGVIIGGIFQVVLQIPFVIKAGFVFKPLWRPSHPGVKKIGRLMLPAILGSAVYQLNSYIGTFLASFLEEGSISWLYYADRLVQFPLGVFAIAISTAALPALTEKVTLKEFDEFSSTLKHSLGLILFICIPSTAGLMILGNSIIMIIFERGAFDTFTTLMTNKALFYYSIGLWSFACNRILLSAFYAFQDTKTPVRIAIITFFLNLLFALLLIGPLRHGGIALALSLSSMSQFFLLFFFLGKKLPWHHSMPFIGKIMKHIMAAIIMGLIIYFLHAKWLIINSGFGILSLTAGLFVIIIIGIIVYLFSAWILGCHELKDLKEMLPRF